jgi:glycosyltransferase involved in cell wall biosynthesis
MQTHENIEYVFVNDCTPDDSIEKLQKVIEQYPERKPFVKIINNRINKGTSASRQVGIDNSTGKYIQLVDNDDWIEPDMVETMYKKAEQEQADIVVCDFVIEKRNSKEYHHDFVPDNNSDYFIYILKNEVCYGYIWTKLIRREFFELPDCRFVDELCWLDDWFALIRISFYAKKIIKIDKSFYHYNRTNINAQTAQRTEWHFKSCIVFFQKLEDFLQNKKIFEKNFDIFDFLKVDFKVLLITHINSYKLRKKYAYLYRDIEMKYINNFHFKSEKLILFFTHYRLFLLAHIVQRLLALKIKIFTK